MASGNDYWKATSPLPSSVYASYLTLPNVTRTFNSIETLFLDGLTVNTRTRAGDNQAAAHFGGDTNGPASLFTVGQKFDKYVLNYTLLDDEGTSTKAESDQLGWDPFYKRPTEITYFKSSSVSVPGPLSLLGLGTAFAYSRKLRRTIKGHRTSSVHSFPTRQL